MLDRRYPASSLIRASPSPHTAQPASHEVHQRVVEVACERGVAQGCKLKTDTTCVESNIHYPTDSSLLGDGIRVLSRSLAHIASECKSGAVKVVNHARTVKYRLLEISRAAQSLTPVNQRRMKKSYKKLVALTRRVVREAGKVMKRWHKGKLPVAGSLLSVGMQMARLKHFVPLVEKVIQQTQQRVFRGNRHVAGKIVSLFEPHSQVIRKGKAHKPNEFGRLVRVDEVENGIVSGYQVLEGNPDDTSSFLPAVQQHQSCFGRAPEMATADRGFFSAKNEREAKQLGVKKVAMPRARPLIPQAGATPEATLVPACLTLARRHRTHHEPLEASFLHGTRPV